MLSTRISVHGQVAVKALEEELSAASGLYETERQAAAHRLTKQKEAAQNEMALKQQMAVRLRYGPFMHRFHRPLISQFFYSHSV